MIIKYFMHLNQPDFAYKIDFVNHLFPVATAFIDLLVNLVGVFLKSYLSSPFMLDVLFLVMR